MREVAVKKQLVQDYEELGPGPPIGDIKISLWLRWIPPGKLHRSE
jgi:hypothetical protein